MSENSEKWHSQLPRAQRDIIRLLTLSRLQSKPQRDSVYSDIKTTILVLERLWPATVWCPPPPPKCFLSKQLLINFLSVESLSYVELAVCVVLIIPAQETARLYFCLSESKMSPGKWWNITGWVNVRGFELVSNKHVHTHPPTHTHTHRMREEVWGDDTEN